MPRNGQGQYILPPLNPVVPDTVIATAWANGTLDDMALALSTSISTDGQTVPTANLPMAGFRHTTVGAALNPNQYARADQVQAFAFGILSAVTVDTGRTKYTGVLPLGSGSAQAFTNLQPILWVPPQNNAGACTLAINTGAEYPITDVNSQPIAANTLHAGNPVFCVWSTNKWMLVTNTLTLAQLNTIFLPLAGGTMAGPITLPGAPASNNQAATKKYVDDAVAGSVAGVASFNTRTGAVTLLSADVINALGYTPLNTAGGTVTGPLTVNSTLTVNEHISTYGVDALLSYVNPAIGTYDIDGRGFTSYIYVMSGPITLTIHDVFANGIIKINFIQTQLGAITFPGNVTWPGPSYTQPDLAAGPRKEAFVSITWNGSVLQANAAVY